MLLFYKFFLNIYTGGIWMYEPYFKWLWSKDDKIIKHLLQICMNSQLLSFRKDQINYVIYKTSDSISVSYQCLTIPYELKGVILLCMTLPICWFMTKRFNIVVPIPTIAEWSPPPFTLLCFDPCYFFLYFFSSSWQLPEAVRLNTKRVGGLQG